MPEAWDDAQIAAFARLREAPAAPLFQPPPYVDDRRRTVPVTVGQWLLVLDEEGGPSRESKVVAAAEVQWSPGHFAKAMLLVSRCEAPDGWEHAVAKAALAMLASATLLVTSAELMILVPLDDETGAALASRGWGEASLLWTARFGADGLHTPLRVASRRVDAYAWWEHPDGVAGRATLSWLDKRVQAEQERAKPKPPPRAGFLKRLNGLLRWS